MSKKNNIIHECTNALKRQERYGESKYEAKKDAKALADELGVDFKNVQGIYSYNTMKTYLKSCKHFINYCLEEHKNEIKHYSDCRKYAEEYLQHEIDKERSAWTIHTKACAICSSYDIRLENLDIILPARKREDIKRTRGSDTSKYKDIDERYHDIKTFIRATGCRRNELLNLRKQDLRWDSKGKHCYVYKRGKGGVEGWGLVNPKYHELVVGMFNRPTAYTVNGEERIFKEKEIPKSAIHDLRADYACEIYEFLVKTKNTSGKRYYCKGERKGDSFDRGALERVSKWMGHHRVDVIVNNYLYGMHGKN